MSKPVLDPALLPGYIDHTLLKPEATKEHIQKLCEEALQYQFRTVCVNGVWVPFCHSLLAGTGVGIAAVCGFPLGSQESTVKAFEAERLVAQGATEIDMVLQVGLLLAGDEAAVREDIAKVVRAAAGAVVKVILETGLLDDESKKTACRLATEAGAHFVKTSTGFGPGGATAADIKLMRAHVPAHVGVKASGGIRDLATALAMIEAGANRIGASAGVSIINGTAGHTAY